jgi:exonuclease III
MFGAQGNTLSGQIATSLAVNGPRPRLVERLTTCLDDAIDLALHTEPDCLCLTQTVLSQQLDHIRSRLHYEGYKSVSWQAAKHPGKHLAVGVVLASRNIAEIIDPEISRWPVVYGGGGASAHYLHQHNTTVVGLHLAHNNQMKLTQLSDLRRFLKTQKEQGRDVIVMGCFDCDLDTINSIVKPEEFGIAGESLDTYPTDNTSRLPWVGRATDYILVKKDEQTNATFSVYDGFSDHRLVTCEVKPRDDSP